MKKKIFFFAAAAAMMAACSSNDSLDTGAVTKTETTLEQGAVGFDAYTGRTTRAGDNGIIKTSANNSLGLQDTGFGVFGFYTDNNEYDGQTIPNFFYNEKIEYNTISGKWGYEPVKYWPNEYGASAIADEADKVSYFAYAPYVTVTPGTGKVNGDTSYGITQLSRNSKTGDPYVKYISSFDWSKNVDLLWGVVPSENTTWKTVAGQDQTLVAGKPWLDVERPREALAQDAAIQRVKFQFEHATAQLNVIVDYDADADGHQETAATDLDESTRVYVRSVSFTGFAMKGALNLNNTEVNTPLWMSYDGESDLEPGDETVINDGRKDGREGQTSAPTEKNPYINPALIQTKAWASDNKGVLNKPQNLFYFPAAEDVAADMLSAIPTGKVDLEEKEAIGLGVGTAFLSSQDYTTGDVNKAMLNWPVMVIPNGDEMTITITYDVETVDSKLANKLSDGSTLGSSIENKITKTITFQGAKNYLEAGKKYIVKLHLGLNSVKFDAEVSEWDVPAIEGENWLPYNLTAYQAPGNYNYTVAAGATVNDAFKLSGFAAGESVTATPDGTVVTGITGSPFTAGASSSATPGIVDVAANAATIEANTTVLNVTTPNAMTFTGVTSGKEVVLNLVQLAAQPDGTNSTLIINSGNTTGTFELKDAAATPNILKGAVWLGSTRNVTIVSAYRNGIAMTELDESGTPTAVTEFKCSGDGQITIGTDATSGEEFIFTIKAGDAGEVTIKCTVA